MEEQFSVQCRRAVSYTHLPLTSIVLETDCPYLAPEPNRGKRNESAYIQYVAEEIARLKGISVEEVLTQTEINAKQNGLLSRCVASDLETDVPSENRKTLWCAMRRLRGGISRYVNCTVGTFGFTSLFVHIIINKRYLIQPNFCIFTFFKKIGY